jgi:precorrin-8X/cobalt-precorrin-8 methylmutase
LAAGWPRPALIVGMPVGYIGAREVKDALIDADATPYIALTGRRGGSAVAAATINALANALSNALAIEQGSGP